MFLILIVIAVHLVWVEGTDNSFMVRRRECPQAATKPIHHNNSGLPPTLGLDWVVGNLRQLRCPLLSYGMACDLKGAC